MFPPVIHSNPKLVIETYSVPGFISLILYFAPLNIIVLVLLFWTSCELLEFSFDWFLPLFVSVAGSTSEAHVVGGGVRSVAHPLAHRIIKSGRTAAQMLCGLKSLNI